jgi:nucleoside-diphosphate-sugar epimerase
VESREVGPINLGNPNTEFSINELVQTFERIFNQKLHVVYSAKMENDPNVRRPDISLASQLLGFSPKVDLEEGLRRTYAHFSEKNERGEI